MTIADLLLNVFYVVDTELAALNLRDFRKRGPRPKLHDSEVITIELVGEFLGHDTDKAIWQHFRRYHLAEFPQLANTDRTTFCRQSANLWRVKQLLHQRIVRLLPSEDPALPGAGPVSLIDSFPLRVCKFKRAPRHRLFREHANYGHDPTGDGLFYGLRVHLRCTDRGVCIAAALAPANVADPRLVAEVIRGEPVGAEGIGDRNYWDPATQQALREKGFTLHAPFRKKSRDQDPRRSRALGKLRQIIEPVIGQLATHFHCQHTWARDMWHLTSRLCRKLLSHTLAVLLNQRQGNPPLQLNLLTTD